MHARNSFTIEVVDYDTRQPLEDVFAIAYWERKKGSISGHGMTDTLKAVEAKSDEKGLLTFPGWGFKFTFMGSMDNSGANILLFKPGYEPKRVVEKKMYGPKTPPWKKGPIELKNMESLQGSNKLEHYRELLERLDSNLHRPILDECHWENTLDFITAFNVELNYYKRSHPNYWWQFGPVHSILLNYKVDNCNSPENLFSSYPIPCPDNETLMKNVKLKNIKNYKYMPKGVYAIGYCESDGNLWVYAADENWYLSDVNDFDFATKKPESRRCLVYSDKPSKETVKNISDIDIDSLPDKDVIPYLPSKWECIKHCKKAYEFSINTKKDRRRLPYVKRFYNSCFYGKEYIDVNQESEQPSSNELPKKEKPVRILRPSLTIDDVTPVK